MTYYFLFVFSSIFVSLKLETHYSIGLIFSILIIFIQEYSLIKNYEKEYLEKLNEKIEKKKEKLKNYEYDQATNKELLYLMKKYFKNESEFNAYILALGVEKTNCRHIGEFISKVKLKNNKLDIISKSIVK